MKNNNNRLNWDETFMNIAIIAAQRSACIFYKVGALFADKNNRIISQGYNGPGEGDYHCNEVGCAKINGDPVSKEKGKCRGIHAEINGLINSFDTTRLKNSRLFITVFPCFSCMKTLNNVGVKEIIYLEEYKRIKDNSAGLEIEWQSMDLAKRRGIKITKYMGKIITKHDKLTPPEDCSCND